MTDRFWQKVAKTPGCWIWTAAKVPRGYGRFYWRGKLRYAHRVALELAGVPVADDELVLHSCDNPRCVNPAHLRTGSQLDNMRDAATKGRIVNRSDWNGSRNPKAKLGASAVEAIGCSAAPTRILAKLYGVSRARIQQIRRDARVKIKVAAEMYPFRFIAVRKERGGGFSEEHFS